MAASPQICRVSRHVLATLTVLLTLVLSAEVTLVVADEPPHPGAALYAEKCARCHGEKGDGTADYPDALTGDKSLVELKLVISRTMPEDTDEKSSPEEAELIAAYMLDQFYSPLAQERNRPATVDFSRLTVRQFESSVADLIGSFRWNNPWPEERGLKASYYNLRSFNKDKLVYERVDPGVNSQFGESKPEGFPTEPDMEKRRPDDIHDNMEFSVQWRGILLAPHTGNYELILRSENGVRLYFQGGPKPVIDGWVSAGSVFEHRYPVRLIGGRSYPISVHFFRYKEKTSSVVLGWKRPGHVDEVIPERYLSPKDSPGLFVLNTPFPPDDRSIGYERGNAISKEWQDAVTQAALETADFVVEKINSLARIDDKTSPEEKQKKLAEFSQRFVERAFRRPLSNDEIQLYCVGPRENVSEEIGLKRVVLLTLMSPHFLYRETGFGTFNDFSAASWLSYTLWDSLPDEQLRKLAQEQKLRTPEQIRQQADRMLSDPRTRAKLLEFLGQWLKLDHFAEITKSQAAFPDFGEGLVSDLRSSLDMMLEEFVNSPDADLRQLMLDNGYYLNGRLAAYYGVELPAEAPFQKITLNDSSRAGVLTHPLLLSGFAYDAESSPIHRGVFIARNILGRRLKPPPEAVAPLAPDLHQDLSTRQRVILQTSPGACMTCHVLINDLGFPLEQFDAVGRYRATDRDRPVDSAGGYLNRDGQQASFDTARGMAEFLANSPEVHEAFVEQLFQYLVKQPVRAFGPDRLRELTEFFAQNNFNVKKLAHQIAVTSAVGVQDLKKTAEKEEKVTAATP